MSYGGGAKCTVCTKSVYAADPKVQADGKTWHASCFTCKECKSQITLAKWAQVCPHLLHAAQGPAPLPPPSPLRPLTPNPRTPTCPAGGRKLLQALL